MIARARDELPQPSLSEDQQRLAARYSGLALHYARPWTLRLPSHADDLRSEAMVGLVKGARAWNAERNGPFPLFCRDFIRSALRSYVRRQRPRGRRTRKADRVPRTLCLMAEPVDHRTGSTGTELEQRDAIESLLRRLPAPLGDVCRALYLDGQSRASLAQEIGRSRTSVNRLHHQAIVRLRAELISVEGGPARPRPSSPDS